MSQKPDGRVACSSVLLRLRYTQPFHTLSEVHGGPQGIDSYDALTSVTKYICVTVLCQSIHVQNGRSEFLISEGCLNAASRHGGEFHATFNSMIRELAR